MIVGPTSSSRDARKREEDDMPNCGSFSDLYVVRCDA
jgi:hypothetical protein